ncbi:MAG: xanthine dehydrogenase molybdopterin binding subunit [Bacteroidia bacterium]
MSSYIDTIPEIAESPKKVPHESGALHVTGEATYIDDMLVNERLLHGHVYTSPQAHAQVVSFDLSAAKALEGVFAVLSHKDIPGENQMGPAIKDELVLATDKVIFVGQAMFLIAAKDEATALKAASLIQVEYELLPAVLTIRDAMDHGVTLQPSRKISRGDSRKAINGAELKLRGEIEIGAQEHWYLETQVCLCVPGEGREIKAYSSTQHPSETQALIAEVLHLQKNEVEVQIRRMGGAFGGKETQANHTAIWTALLAQATGRPVKIRLFRDDDQKMTGKRHRFLAQYEVGFDQTGRIHGLEMTLNADGGSSTDLTMAVLERAMMHADSSYYLADVSIVGHPWFLNLPSNTAFRGFGGPQGMAVTENIVDRIARQLGLDPDEVRLRNYYEHESRNTTPYEQVVENNRLYLIREQLRKSAEYEPRRKAVADWNAEQEFIKRGISLTPVKFGISFTTSFLNQAGALVHIYQDGTVLVNHGGTEMGQGLHTKIRQIAALELGVSLSRVKVNATNTAKVPNTSATAASAGTDLNGAAVKNAIDQIKARMLGVAAKVLSQGIPAGEPLSELENIVIQNDEAFDSLHPERRIAFPKLCAACVFHQVSLSSTGYYRTPDVHFDRANGRGKPYHYFSFGMAVSEVEVDVLTGHVQVLRADLLHDVGESINPAIDIGQVEGAYIQGLGWVTTEECKWDAKGNLLNHSPDTYKIPNVQDMPLDFRTNLLQGVPNPNTIRRSKAVAEPPFMLAFSAWLAIKDAISSVAQDQLEPMIQIPMTNEAILISVEDLRKRMKGKA